MGLKRESLLLATNIVKSPLLPAILPSYFIIISTKCHFKVPVLILFKQVSETLSADNVMSIITKFLAEMGNVDIDDAYGKEASIVEWQLHSYGMKGDYLSEVLVKEQEKWYNYDKCVPHQEDSSEKIVIFAWKWEIQIHLTNTMKKILFSNGSQKKHLRVHRNEKHRHCAGCWQGKIGICSSISIGKNG